MDDEQAAVLVSAAHDPHMDVLRVKYQVPGLGLGPQDRGAGAMLGGGSAAVAYDILAPGGVVKYPIHHARTVQPVGAVGPGGGAALGSHLPQAAPAVVPAQDQGFATPPIVHLSHQGAGSLHYRPSRGVQVLRQRLHQGSGVRLRDRQVCDEAVQQLRLRQELVQSGVLVIGEAVQLPHVIGGPGLHGDPQNGLAAVLPLLCLGGDGGHVPEYVLQPLHPVRVQGDHVHAILGEGGADGEHRQYLPPVRELALELDVGIVPSLQLGQIVRKLYIHLGDGPVGWDRARLRLLSRQKDPEGGGDHGGRQNGDAQGQQKGSAAQQTRQGADHGRGGFHRACHGLSGEAGGGLGRLPGPADGELPGPGLGRTARRCLPGGSCRPGHFGRSQCDRLPPCLGRSASGDRRLPAGPGGRSFHSLPLPGAAGGPGTFPDDLGVASGAFSYGGASPLPSRRTISGVGTGGCGRHNAWISAHVLSSTVRQIHRLPCRRGPLRPAAPGGRGLPRLRRTVSGRNGKRRALPLAAPGLDGFCLPLLYGHLPHPLPGRGWLRRQIRRRDLRRLAPTCRRRCRWTLPGLKDLGGLLPGRDLFLPGREGGRRIGRRLWFGYLSFVRRPGASDMLFPLFPYGLPFHALA